MTQIERDRIMEGLTKRNAKRIAALKAQGKWIDPTVGNPQPTKEKTAVSEDSLALPSADDNTNSQGEGHAEL